MKPPTLLRSPTESQKEETGYLSCFSGSACRFSMTILKVFALRKDLQRIIDN